MIVVLFVLIDLIILVTYTVVMWYTDDKALGSKEIINIKDPQDVRGVSGIARDTTLSYISHKLVAGSSNYHQLLCVHL